jgi:hypothetical protein
MKGDRRLLGFDVSEEGFAVVLDGAVLLDGGFGGGLGFIGEQDDGEDRDGDEDEGHGDAGDPDDRGDFAMGACGGDGL